MKCFLPWISDRLSEWHTKTVYHRGSPDGEQEAEPAEEGFPATVQNVT